MQIAVYVAVGITDHAMCTTVLCRCNVYHSIKAPPDWREIFTAVATAIISPKFRVDCDKAIRVVIHTNATVLW